MQTMLFGRALERLSDYDVVSFARRGVFSNDNGLEIPLWGRKAYDYLME